MLAYVFWHWLQPDVPLLEYEARLREFHESLRVHPPNGFIQSAAFRVAGAPWTPVADAYEDWYLIEDFTALGVLNEASVNGPRKQPHDSIARLVSGGTGGVYRMLFSKTNPMEGSVARWFSKPEGMTYAALESKVIHSETSANSLWKRQLVLGPTPEFCLRGHRSEALPLQFSPILLPLKPVVSFE